MNFREDLLKLKEIAKADTEARMMLNDTEKSAFKMDATRPN